MKKLPVFVFPITLEFYLAARHTHKQLMTIYNPYDFPIHFQVMCTSPHKFTVTDPEGVIAPLSCVDVAVRYSQPSSAHCSSCDKFRITVHDRVTNQVLGKRIVLAKFCAGEPEGAAEGAAEERGEAFQALPQGARTRPQPRPSAALLALCAACALALLLPSAAPPAPTSPPLLRALCLPPSLQLACSFVLGLLTCVLLRP